MNQGNIPGAITEFKTAIRINPNYAEARSALGGAYFIHDKLDEAIFKRLWSGGGTGDGLVDHVKHQSSFVTATNLEHGKRVRSCLPLLRR